MDSVPAPGLNIAVDDGHHRADSLRGVVLWGVVVGVLNAAAPFAFWWVEPATVYAMGLAVIAAIYIGFAVADGRARVIVAETVVAAGFVILAAISVTASAWFAVVGLTAHGLKDFWQYRTRFVATTRWWPPFCAAVDFVAAAIIAIALISGVDLH
jgi:hypothetical protein